MTIEFDGINNKLGTTTANSVTIKTNNTDAITINSSQQVGVGTTSPNKDGITKALTINSPVATNYSGIELSTADTLRTALISNSNGGYLYTATDIPLVFQTNNVERARFTSAGLHIGGTGSANALDDYEEGTWTPVVQGGTTVGTGTYGDQQGIYTKVGNLVTASFWITWTAHTGTGNFFVYGLPFASANGTDINLQAGSSYASAFDAGTNATALIVYPTAGSTFFSFRGFVNATNRTIPQMQSTGQIGVTISYRVQ